MKMTNTELKLKDTGQAKVVNISRPPFFLFLQLIVYIICIYFGLLSIIIEFIVRFDFVTFCLLVCFWYLFLKFYFKMIPLCLIFFLH